MDLEEFKLTIPCRDSQLDLLDSYASLGNLLRILIVHGINSGKQFILNNYFNLLKESKDDQVNIVNFDCSAVISLRSFYEKTLQKIVEVNGNNDEQAGFCDSLNKFMIKLENIIQTHNITKLHYLIFEDFGSLGDFTDLLQLIFGLNKVMETSSIIKDKFVLVILLNNYNLYYTSDNLGELNNYSLPTIFFQNYTQNEVFHILTDSITSSYLIHHHCKFEEKTTVTTNKNSDNCNRLNPEQQQFWEDFVKLVIDSFHSFTGSNVTVLVELILKIWPTFTKKIFVDKTYNFNDLLRLYKENQSLFKGESVVNDSFIDEPTETNRKVMKSIMRHNKSVIDLPVYSKFVLCAAYLASFIAPKYDFVIFSRLKELSSRKKYHQKIASSKGQGAINTRLLNPAAFELERMLAILSSIYGNTEEEILFSKPGKHPKISFNVEFYSQFSNLVSLNLITKALAATNTANLDLLNGKLKFKANFNYDFIEQIAKDLNFKIEEYLMD